MLLTLADAPRSDDRIAEAVMMDMRRSINNALHLKMEQDDRIYLMGEDIGTMGGFFGVTAELQARFGPQRVMDSPLSETALVGAAIGMAVYGLRPVVEIVFMDFIYPAADQIINELAKLRFRSGGQFTAPVVIRAPYGGGIGGGLYHSQSCEAMFLHVPGLKVVTPSTPCDAKGLLISAMEDEDPVLFLEPKRLYTLGAEEVPAGLYRVPLGQARVARSGRDITLIGYGAMVPVALEAAAIAIDRQIDCEVIDLRTLNPWDEAIVLESVARTRRAAVIHEAPLSCGFGAEISARIMEELFGELGAPVIRIAGYDTPYPYALEHVYAPSARRIVEMICDRW